MDWSVLMAAKPPIPLHALAALFALFLGAAQFALPKGTRLHRVLGYTWVVTMTVVAITAAFINDLRIIGAYSPIHLLIPVVLVTLWMAVRAARSGDIARHRRLMIRLYLLAMVVTGLFTLLPGRTMHEVLFGS